VFGIIANYGDNPPQITQYKEKRRRGGGLAHEDLGKDYQTYSERYRMKTICFCSVKVFLQKGKHECGD